MPDETPSPAATNYNVANFTRCPCAVSYKGTLLGGTEDAPKITPEFTTEDVTCNQAGGRTVIKRVTKFKITVKATFLEPSVVLPLVKGLTGTIDSSVVGSNLYSDAGALVLSEIGGNRVFTFPLMTAILDEYNFDGTKEHTAPVTFESVDTATTFFTESSAGAGNA